MRHKKLTQHFGNLANLKTNNHVAILHGCFIFLYKLIFKIIFINYSNKVHTTLKGV